jgi:serine/threonine protein kinase/formylglycine-generating enzyme required for sulfatase activity
VAEGSTKEQKRPDDRGSRNTVTATSTSGVDDVDDNQRDDEVLARGATVGRYLVLERLGAGAMGVVYAAYDPKLDRKIALKLLRPVEGRGDQARRTARLEREAQAMAKLSHPNVGAIFDVGVYQDQVFLAMEYLSGGTLRQWIDAEKRPWRGIVKMFIGVGHGLAAAHTEGLIHRDFKPDNVLLDKAGTPKVVDFGLVRLTSSIEVTSSGSYDDPDLPIAETAIATSGSHGSAALTRTGALAGTPAYMAAEQFLGKPIDARTDQFAFAVSLYEALYSERPFAGDTVISLADSVTTGRVRNAPDEAGVPVWLRSLLLRAVSPDSADRYSTIRELLNKLEIDPSLRRKRVTTAVGLFVAFIAIAIVSVRSVTIQRRRLGAQIDDYLLKARDARRKAHTSYDDGARYRTKALQAFATLERSEGEAAWSDALGDFEAAAASYSHTETLLESAAVSDPTRTDVRDLFGDVLFDHALLAEEQHDPGLVDSLVARFRKLDSSGTLARRWAQPGFALFAGVPVTSDVQVEILEGRADGSISPRALDRVTGPGTASAMPLAPGTYRATVLTREAVLLRQVFSLARGQTLTVDLAPPLDSVPDGFVYIPSGDFLFGEADESLRVSFLDTVPLHKDHMDSFLIARDETTFAQWLTFVDSLPAAQRSARLPQVRAPQGSIEVKPTSSGEWELVLQPTTATYVANYGEAITYPGRTRRRRQDWLRFPVSGISANDATAYLEWLRRTGRVPNARLCTEREWERAARGADDRVFPHGNRLLPDDANIDITYSRMPLAFGPDAVGSHPASNSPFDVCDLCGNVIEMTTGVLDGSRVIARGGAYYYDRRSARLTNREPMDPSLRFPTLGLRVCASVQHSTQRGSQ